MATGALCIAVPALVYVAGIFRTRPAVPHPPVANAASAPRSSDAKVDRSDPATATPKPAAPPANASVRWAVSSQPSGAAVVDDSGRILGTTPFTQELPATAGSTNLRLRRDGYSEVTVKLDRQADTTQMIKLTPVPVPPGRTPSRRPASLAPKTPNQRPVTSSHSELPYEP